MKYSYLLTAKIINTALWEYKVIYPDETFDYMTKVDFDAAQVIFL